MAKKSGRRAAAAMAENTALLIVTMASTKRYLEPTGMLPCGRTIHNTCAVACHGTLNSACASPYGARLSPPVQDAIKTACPHRLGHRRPAGKISASLYLHPAPHLKPLVHGLDAPAILCNPA